MCQICIRELYGTWRKYNCEDLQVHHIVPINSDEELRLDDNNLITLCSMHHAMCDRGEIPYEEGKAPQSTSKNVKKWLYTDSPPKFTPTKLNLNFLECVAARAKSRTRL